MQHPYDEGYLVGYSSALAGRRYNNTSLHSGQDRVDYQAGYLAGWDDGMDALSNSDPVGPCLCGRGECPECGNGK